MYANKKPGCNGSCLLTAMLLTSCTGQPKRAVVRAQLADTASSANPQPPASPGVKEDTAASDTLTENAIMDTVFSLPEVRQSAAGIEAATKGKRHLHVWIADAPNPPDDPCYVVNTGEDNGSSLVAENTFYVYLHPVRILYYDNASDTAISLQTWRQNTGK